MSPPPTGPGTLACASFYIHPYVHIWILHTRLCCAHDICDSIRLFSKSRSGCSKSRLPLNGLVRRPGRSGEKRLFKACVIRRQMSKLPSQSKPCWATSILFSHPSCTYIPPRGSRSHAKILRPAGQAGQADDSYHSSEAGFDGTIMK